MGEACAGEEAVVQQPAPPPTAETDGVERAVAGHRAAAFQPLDALQVCHRRRMRLAQIAAIEDHPHLRLAAQARHAVGLQTTLYARNASGATTTNYGTFAVTPRPATLAITSTYTATPVGSPSVSVTSPQLTATTGGTATYNSQAADTLTMARSLTTPTGPVMLGLTMVLTVTDTADTAVTGNQSVTTPSPPTNMQASSLKMSPNRFVVTITSNCSGARTNSIAQVSTSISFVLISGYSCAISKATASLMTEAVRGKPVADVEQMFAEFRDMTGGREGGKTGALPSKLNVLSGVRRFPMRVKCATLAWHALHKALNSGAP